MSKTHEQMMEEKKVYTSSTSSEEPTTRSLFTRQTGQALITLGTLFKHIPPFNETIDSNTGETLITIGKKLKSRK